jgi:tetratricopeptide (TPR) repeat protein
MHYDGVGDAVGAVRACIHSAYYYMENKQHQNAALSVKRALMYVLTPPESKSASPSSKGASSAANSRLVSALWSLLGRVYLQGGDLVSAEACFRHSADGQGSADQCAVSSNTALLNLAKAQFAPALELFSEVIATEPGSGTQNSDAVNNYATCALHNNQVDEAIDTLESLVAANPMINLNESVASNLWCLYKIKESSGRDVALKRQLLHSLINLYAPDGFKVSFE